jgi:predicted double-glycine peptidase
VNSRENEARHQEVILESLPEELETPAVLDGTAGLDAELILGYGPPGSMSYILLLLIIAIVPLKLGNFVAGRVPRRHHLGFAASLLVAIATTGLWFGLSMWARRYSETDRAGWQAAEWWAQTGKWYFFGTAGLFFLGVASQHEGFPLARRNILLHSVAVLAFLWITVWRTCPVYAFLPRGEIRDKTGCLRQTMPYTCGPVSLANLLEHYGMGNESTTERELARLSGTTYEGTTMSGLTRAARANGLRIVACRKMTLDELEKQGTPAIVFISTIPAVRHAVLYIGSTVNSVETLDPDRGHLFVPKQRFREILYGKALLLAK